MTCAVPILVDSDHCWTKRECLTLHYT